MVTGSLKYVLDLMDKNFGTGIRKAKGETQGLDTAVNRTNASIRRLGMGIVAALSLNAVASFAGEVTKTTAQVQGMENAITFASGNEGQKNIRYLDDTIKNLNLDLIASYKGFQTLTGSLKGTKLEGQGARDIFEAVGIASSVMNLSAEQSEGAFLALSQMASKGKVSAEELRQQLGERIPGALNIAARAMGMTQPAFNELLESGDLYAEDFLPKFAKELKATFEGGLGKAAESMQASINKKNNALVSFKTMLGDVFGTEIKKALDMFSNLLSGISDIVPYLLPVKDAFMNILSALSPLWDGIQAVFAAFGTAKSTTDSLTGALNIIAGVVEVFATGIATLLEWLAPLAPIIVTIIALQWAWNIAMAANPIGAIIMAIVGLVGAITVAYNKVGWFRGAIKAAWETLKGFATMIKDYVINRFKELLSGITGIGKTLLLFFKGDWKGAWEAGKKATSELMGVGSAKKLIDDAKKVGKNAAQAYAQGVAEADKNKAKSGTGAPAKTANEKLLKGDVPVPGLGDDKNSKTVPKSSLPAGGGRTEKHTTFNIQSFVKEMKFYTATDGMSPAELKRQITGIFNEIVADLEVRADA